MRNKIRLLYLTPHLSTGGMPQFVLKRIKELQKFKDQIEIFLVEFSKFSDTYVVQRNEIINLLGDGHFFSLGDTKDTERKSHLIDIIKNNHIHIVHSEEMLEGFESFNKIPLTVLNELYSNDRTWKIIETCHNIWFNPQTHKKFNPDAYCFVTPYHLKDTFSKEKPMKFLSLYPIEDKVTEILKENEIYGNFNQVPLIEKIKVRNELGLDMFKTHVLNVGLWTSGKNQGEGINVARELVESNPDIEFHFIGNQAPNFEEYWGPIMKDLPSNVKVWGERSDVDKFMTACDVLMFNSTWECNPLVVRESINYGMKIIARDLPQYMGMFDDYITPIEGDVKNISKQLVNLINSKDEYKILPDKTFGEDLLAMYQTVSNLDVTENKPLKNDYTFVRHYVTQPYFEVLGTSDNKLKINCYDGNNNNVYQNELSINSWIKLKKEYFIKWRTTVEENGEMIYDQTLDLKDKRVYISFGSKSLGDTMAWIPYCEIFREKHGCELIVSTFLNSLFKDQYPNIKFVEPGDLVPNIHAQYRLGWFYNEDGKYDNNKHPFDFKKIPLQKTATDILGLDYKEVRPLLKLPNTPKKKKVGIGFHSTAQAKYWNNPNGWQSVVDHLNDLGYECMIYSKEGDGYMNNVHPKGVTIFKGGNLQEVIDDLSSCEFFIGLGSGLSWLAWACKLPVVLISGFSEKWAETTLDTYRVINENVCHGCFNSERLDAGDWNWCPLHKNTERMFECTKKISSDMVVKEINNIIKKESISDLVTIILSHANTKQKRKILIELLKNIKTKILLSTNYPIDGEIKGLCDYVIYDEENPILLKDEFGKYNAFFYWSRFEDGVEVKNNFDYEHGYAVYKLIQNGLTESKKLGFNNSHIINYDYLINENTLQDNYKLLENYDSVFYVYNNKPYNQDSYSTGFFTGKIDELIKPFTFYKTKDEYYNYDGHYKILEIITNDAVKKQNLKVKELFYEDLMETSVVNRVNDTHKQQKTLQMEYENQCNISSDINEHIPTLYKYSLKCDHITEMGVRYVSSTWAFLNARPKKLISYDIIKHPNIDNVINISYENNLNFEFIESDVLKVKIEPTELLFLDTLHTYNQLSKELELHSDMVSKYIILHDTVSFGYNDEEIYDHASDIVKSTNNEKKGLLNAINDFILSDNGKHWEIHETYTNNNGLLILKNTNKIIKKEVMLDKNDDHQFDWGKKSDWYVDAAVKEIFEDNTYERFFEVEEGDVVVDLGASLGPFTYSILPKNPKQCYVVEPLSYQIDVLHKNVGRENVKIIQGAITDKKKIEISWDYITESVPTFTFKEFLDENNITHIDFLKCDCEGGEYDVFQQSNIEFLKTIPKIVTEFHMRNDDNFHKCKFRWFRDNIFPQFDNIQIYSVDGVDIKWDLWNEHFLEWYDEIIVYMDNRK